MSVSLSNGKSTSGGRLAFVKESKDYLINESGNTTRSKTGNPHRMTDG